LEGGRLTVFECSHESGIYPVYMLSGIRDITFFYLCSPFLRREDVDYWRDFAEGRGGEGVDFRVVTDRLAMIASANLDKAGRHIVRRCGDLEWASKELGITITLPRAVEDLRQRFLWWWEEAGW